jgi:NAD dependent epimerase/dehydratase family enzyme
LGAWFGSGKQWQSWIHIQDLVQLFMFAMNHPGTYNGVSPNPVTQKQLVKAISRQYKMPQWLPGIPAFLIKMAMGKMASILFDSIRVSSAHVQEKGFSFVFPSIQEALQDLLPLNSKK